MPCTFYRMAIWKESRPFSRGCLIRGPYWFKVICVLQWARSNGQLVHNVVVSRCSNCVQSLDYGCVRNHTRVHVETLPTNHENECQNTGKLLIPTRTERFHMRSSARVT